MEDHAAAQPDRDDRPTATRQMVEHMALAAELAADAHSARAASSRQARGDAVALVTAVTHRMGEAAESILTPWLTPDGRATARTYVLAQELLLLAALYGERGNEILGLPRGQFTGPRFARASAHGRAQALVGQLVTAQVRGQSHRIELVFAAYLAPHHEPADVHLFMTALACVAASCARHTATRTGRPVSHFLAGAGLAAAQ